MEQYVRSRAEVGDSSKVLYDRRKMKRCTKFMLTYHRVACSLVS